eukprot:GDKJ01046563.1.p1 GENE.GDKJ01046563.1~~GDKJ01046563.1.p1  ORF type:complete len:162 (-),score=35.67 GDKJ01046563.1:45-530(-)
MGTIDELFGRAKLVGSVREYKKVFEENNVNVDDMLSSSVMVTPHDFPEIVGHSDRIALLRTIEEWRDKIRGYAILETGGKAPCSTWFKYKSDDIFQDFKNERGYEVDRNPIEDENQVPSANASVEFHKIDDDADNSSAALYARTDEDSSFHNSSDEDNENA